MKLRILTCLAVAGVLLPFTLAGPPNRDAEASTTWNVGDVFAGVSNGSYNVYDNDGVFKETISDGLGGFTTGCAFNPALDKLYTTNFSNTKVVVYDNASPHAIVQTVDTNATSPNGHTESVVFAANGHFFAGHPDSPTASIHEYDAAGVLVDNDTVADDARGADWIDLASDQATMFYSSEGRNIQRYDVVNDVQLPIFTTLPGSGFAFALRLLPPGDGSGGLLVADSSNVKRLDGTGAVVQTYDVGTEDGWFALNLDPNGTSFWSGDQFSGNFYRFNIASGAVEVGPIATAAGSLFGLCVKGEPTVAVPTTERTEVTCDDLATRAAPPISGANKAFAAEYPTDPNDNWALWGPNKWWLFGPIGSFTTKSCGFHPNKRPIVTSNRISFVREARLVEFDILNHGTTAANVSISCDGGAGTPPVVGVLAAGQSALDVPTNWTGFCLNITVTGSNGKITLDNLVFERPAKSTVGPLVHFNDKAGQNQKLIGQYPVGLIDWGTSATGDWYHSGPFSGFPTKSLSLRQQETQGTFTYVGGDRILVSLQLTTGWQASTQTLKCLGNPDVVVNLAADEYRSMATGWTVPCSAVTIVSSNGWGTNYDNLLLNPEDID